MKKTRLAVLAAEYFKESGLRGYVGPNGDLLSAFEYAIYAYQQSMALQLSGGSGRINASDDKKSKSGAASLRTMLEAMLVDIRTTPLTSAGAVATKWGPRLIQFDRGSYRISDFVVKALNDCFDFAEKQITHEMRNPSTEMGRARDTLRHMRSINPNADLRQPIKEFEK